MRMEGVTRAGLLVKPKSAFARDGKTKLRPEIVEERHKAHLAEQGENARVVLETRAELVLKQQQKEQAQREIRATAREERRKARRQARRREMEEQGQQYDSDEFEVDEGADTVTEAESIRDAEDARALKMEDEDRKFAEKRVGSSAGNWILDCLARFGGGGGEGASATTQRPAARSCCPGGDREGQDGACGGGATRSGRGGGRGAR
jgi:hypothetical protein